MTKDSAKQQEKLDELRVQIAENKHPQQSEDRSQRVTDAQKAVEKIIEECTTSTSQQNS